MSTSRFNIFAAVVPIKFKKQTMKAISKRQHQELITAFQQLEALLPLHTCHMEGIPEQLEALTKHYDCYEHLLEELATCITAYEQLHRRLKVHVLAPALRQVKHTQKQNTLKQDTNPSLHVAV